jgi:hypothetical protein
MSQYSNQNNNALDNMNIFKVMKMATREEKHLYKEMNTELSRLSSYHVRKHYYPNRLDAWNAEYRAIEHSYRTKIHNMICAREKQERIEKEQQLLNDAATGLIMMQRPRRKRTPVLKDAPLRRSTRIKAQQMV